MIPSAAAQSTRPISIRPKSTAPQPTTSLAQSAPTLSWLPPPAPSARPSIARIEPPPMDPLPPSPPVFAPIQTVSFIAPPSSRSLSSSAPTHIDYLTEYHRKRRADAAAATSANDTADDAADSLALSKSPTIISILLQSHPSAPPPPSSSSHRRSSLSPNLEVDDEGDDVDDGDGVIRSGLDELQFNISLDEAEDVDIVDGDNRPGIRSGGSSSGGDGGGDAGDGTSGNDFLDESIR